MATFRDLELDWSMLNQDCPECWTDSDLQLAAELGKTLLERNKELETSLKQHQNVIEDQAQEIEYLTKQTAALREVNDSRLRIYEQLEVSIQDLERSNHRLVVENSSDKKHMKSLTSTIENLEAKCEDLQITIDDLRLQVDVLKRRMQKPSPNNAKTSSIKNRTSLLNDNSNYDNYVDETDNNKSINSNSSLNQESTDDNVEKTTEDKTDKKHEKINEIINDIKSKEDEALKADSSLEQISQLLTQLRDVRTQSSREQRKIIELEEQLANVLQQNQKLENEIIQLHNNREDDNMKSMHQELNILEEVRKGQMCTRCLRNIERNDEEIFEDDDSSILNELMHVSHHRASFSMDVQDHRGNQSSPAVSKQSPNPYKDLVEKYEALLEVHRHPIKNPKPTNNYATLQEELQMSGDFNTLNTKDTDEESGHGDSLPTEPHKKTRIFSQTPTDFSEAETSSSGFSDETSNKYTQTDERTGSFLCTIADGDDCKFSIYDDTSPISSRFRNRPEYQELFKEIFMVLKSAAENKAIGESLPLIAQEDQSVVSNPNETTKLDQSSALELMTDDDDSQSVLSSTMSELSVSHNEPTTVIENVVQAENPETVQEAETTEVSNDRKTDNQTETVAKENNVVLKPLIRQPLEYVSVEVRKRSSSRRNKNKFIDRSDSPVTHIIGSPTFNYSNRPSSGRNRRRAEINKNNAPGNEWNGHTVQFWSTNRNSVPSPTPSQNSNKGGYSGFKPSSASQGLHKLIKLDLSYAEVLRNANNTKKSVRQRRK